MRSWIKYFIAAAFILVWCYLAFSGLLKLPELDMAGTAKSTGDQMDWKTANLYAKPLPEDLKKGEVKLETGRIQVEGINMFFRKASPPAGLKSSGQSILLLHGKNFKSETWENLGTLHIMAALGHVVVAVDLPGFGETKESYSGDKSKFVQSIIKSQLLNGNHPVLVAPSMSGEYAVKFVGEHADLLSGFVPVAPVASNSVPRTTLQAVKVPTLVVYGDKDDTPMAKQAPENFKVMPNSQEVVIKGAGHPAYRDQPDVFHKIMHNFMELLHQ